MLFINIANISKFCSRTADNWEQEAYVRSSIFARDNLCDIHERFKTQTEGQRSYYFLNNNFTLWSELGLVENSTTETYLQSIVVVQIMQELM